MTVDIIAIITLVGGLIVLVKAILEVANVRSQIQSQIERSEEKLDRKIEMTYERIKDDLDRAQKEFELYKQINTAEENRREDVWDHCMDNLTRRYQAVKKDLWDVQSFLQHKLDFKIRLNSPTLDRKEK